MNVIIYGTGFYGTKALKTISNYENISVIGYADSFKRGEANGLPILDLKEWKEKNETTDVYVVIAIANFGGPVRIYWELKQLGYPHIFYYLHKDYTSKDDFLNGECLDMGLITEETLPYVELHVMDSCNLNCVGCTHFSALFDEEIPDTERRIGDIEKLKSIFHNIFVIALLGGEPLLNPNVCEYLDRIRTLLPDTEIQLVTNGLRIPYIEDAFFKCVKNNNVTLCISEYKPTSSILDVILTRVQKFDLDYSIRSYDIKQKFNKPLSLSPKSIYPKKCISDGCVEVCDGKIARCPSLMFISKMNEVFGVELPSDGILDIDEISDAKSALEVLNREVPLCKHCIQNEIEWGVCGKKPYLEDFAVYE